MHRRPSYDGEEDQRDKDEQRGNNIAEKDSPMTYWALRQVKFLDIDLSPVLRSPDGGRAYACS